MINFLGPRSSRIGTHARRKPAGRTSPPGASCFSRRSLCRSLHAPNDGMPREPASEVDGVAALLAFAEQRLNGDHPSTFNNLSSVVAPVAPTSRPTASAQNALDLLQPSASSATLARTATLLAQKDSLQPVTPLYDRVAATPRLPGQVHSEALSNPNNLDNSRPKNLVPRLPPMATSEGRTHNDSLLGSKVAGSPRTHIPRLVGLSDWPSRSPSLSNPVVSIPPMNPPQFGSGLPTSLPPLPSQPRSEYGQSAWINTTVPRMHVPYSTSASSVIRDYRPHSSHPLYPLPVHQAPVQTSEDYYFQRSTHAQYVHVPNTLPRYPPSPAPPYSTLSSSNFLSTPSLQRHPFQANHDLANALPPIGDRLGKSIAKEDSTGVSCGDTVRVHFPTMPSTASRGGESMKSEPPRKPMFKGPASSERGFVDLMNPDDTVNPTDTLAIVASSSEPLPLEPVQTESPPEVRKASSAKIKMARDLFGTGDDLLTSRANHDSPISRNKEVRSPSEKFAVPVGNGKVRGKRKDLDRADSELRSPKSTSKKCTTQIESPRHGDRELKKIGKSSRRYLPHTVRRVIEHDDDDEDDTDEEEDDNEFVSGSDGPSEITRCPCGSVADSGTMIACDQCNTWQHRICMGFRRKSEVPKRYYCHICRPQDIRTNCVAHPKYKERMMMKDEDDRCEPILLSVKPLELRKLYMADLRARRDGTRVEELDIVFKRYARLYRTHFGKDRQSVVEGLVVLTELPRKEVEGMFDIALKRSKKEVFDNLNIPIDHTDRRKAAVTSSDSIVTTPVHNGALSQPRSSQKRSRPVSVFEEGGMESTDHEVRQQMDITPDKELSQGERNRLSREERKNLQVMSLFKRLDDRERDKKRPRYGEPSGSPRAPALASPRSMGGGSARPGLSPTGSMKLLPSIDHRSPDTSGDGRNVISIDVSQYESGSQIPIAKRERSAKEKKDNRRKENRDSGDARRQGGIFSTRRQRQTLSSVTVRKRGKSESNLNAAELDPSLRIKVKVPPGVSVIGSKLIPRSRRSRLDNEAIEREEPLRADTVSCSMKDRLISSRRSVDAGFVSARRPPVHPIRRRLREIERTRGILCVKSVIEKEKNASDTAVPDANTDHDMAPQSTKSDPVPDHDIVGRDFCVKKRMLIRTDPEISKSKYAVNRHIDATCFKKRLMRIGPSKIVSKPKLVSKPRVVTKPKASSKPKIKSGEISLNVIKESERKPTLEQQSGTGKKSAADTRAETRNSTGKDSAKKTVSPKRRDEAVVVTRPANGYVKSPVLQTNALSFRSLPVPVRTPPTAARGSSTEKLRPPMLVIPSRSLASSPLPNSFRTPPPQRTTTTNRETKSGPGKLGGSTNALTPPGPSFRLAPSPSPRSARSPPTSFRSAPFSRMVPLRSKPVSALVSTPKDTQPNGNSATLNINETASDILQSRLEGFLSQSKKPTTPVANDTPAPSPRIPKVKPVHGPVRHTRNMNPVNTTPRLGMKPKYGAGAPVGQWRSFDGPKRVVASAAPGGMGVRMGDKSKVDGRMRGNGNRMAKPNGTSNPGASAWSQYRRQNGWAPVTGGKPYTAPGGASSSHDGKSNARRRPYG